MLSPTEIYDNLDALAANPPSDGAFGLGLMEAVGAPRSTITKLKDKAAEGAFTWTRMLRFEVTEPGGARAAVARMKAEAEAAAKSKRPRILLAYDGAEIAAHDTKIGDEVAGPLDELSAEGELFFPLGGHERHIHRPERLADVRATKYISRFFDAVRDANPDWTTTEDRHAMNLFIARVLFCLFSDDVGIFTKDVFKAALKKTQVDGSDLGAFFVGAFTHMNTPEDARTGPTRGWSKLRYVNGGLFEEATPTPVLDGQCRRHLLTCAGQDWRSINPDIFGSMLQAVVDVEKRGELGMHYTSQPNILKVLGPILLKDLENELEKAKTNKTRLRAFLERLGRVRVFDPACGSGNFLIVAYKEMRALEMEAFRRLGTEVHPVVELDSFYGIEIDDFACQAARLGLWIAEYQMNVQAEMNLGQTRAFLPLSDAGQITWGNAAWEDWLDACPPEAGAETVVVGNPQFRGSSYWTPSQKADMAHVFKERAKTWGNLDYVALWFLKAADYAEATGAPFALVSTNSIVQGVQVGDLWPLLLENLEIHFAHRSFTWSNLAKHNAGVTCVIVGMGRPCEGTKRLVDGETVRDVEVIGPYLAPNTTAVVVKTNQRISSDLSEMTRGNQPTDGGNLFLDRTEREDLLLAHPEAERFVRRIYGSQELMKGMERWCLWIADSEYKEAKRIPELARRFEAVTEMRLDGSNIAKSFADRPYRFLQRPGVSSSHTIMVPRVSSLNREWLPVDLMDHTAIVHDRLFGIFDGAIWQAGILSSRMHRLWLETVGGRLKEDPSYSNQLVWNTFPLPPLSERRKGELEEHWWEIDLARKEAGFGKTLGELYKPDAMPAPLRRAHEELDATMETIFGSRRYRSDADRIEHMLQLYERRIAEEAGAAPTKRPKPKKEQA